MYSEKRVSENLREEKKKLEDKLEAIKKWGIKNMTWNNKMASEFWEILEAEGR